jgi:hypothetical protein
VSHAFCSACPKRNRTPFVVTAAEDLPRPPRPHRPRLAGPGRRGKPVACTRSINEPAKGAAGGPQGHAPGSVRLCAAQIASCSHQRRSGGVTGLEPALRELFRGFLASLCGVSTRRGRRCCGDVRHSGKSPYLFGCRSSAGGLRLLQVPTAGSARFDENAAGLAT